MTQSASRLPRTFSPLANALRALAMDAVQLAKSGHPGAPMGMAEMATVLWRKHLKHNPANPQWCDRDRFVLSNGHASMLLYALLHLTGYDLSLDELKRFRQLHSKTPGHPEYGETPGVETTTGPLGQGLANAVGMALAEKLLAHEFNRPGHTIVDHHTYVFVGDGCLMEGISHEACSLAGTWKLGKLIVLYDSNGISIDGQVQGWFTEDTAARFRAYGWHVIEPIDGHDMSAIDAAITLAKAETERPSLIVCRTVIGAGAPHKQGTSDVHGAPLGEAEIAAAREAIGWPYGPFEIPDEIYAQWDARAAGREREAAWFERFEAYRRVYPELADEFERRVAGLLPLRWPELADEVIRATVTRREHIATRKASQNAIAAYAKILPELLGGSADLTGSNLTDWPGAHPVTPEEGGNYLHYGVREFGMVAIANGIALHRGHIPFTGTFLVFSDYARNAIRMAALMRQRQILVLTHDSIGLGEDGPTHQPIEHAASLRLIPNLDVWRPADSVETAVAWRLALERTDGPSALLLSRQNLPFIERSPQQIEAIGRGGYVLREAKRAPDLILIATGSEIALALDAQGTLAASGIAATVVSLPCTRRFDAQPPEYRAAVLPPDVPKLAIEAGSGDGWWRYVGDHGDVLGIDRFGASAPAPRLFEFFGFTVDHVVARAKLLLSR